MAHSWTCRVGSGATVVAHAAACTVSELQGRSTVCSEVDSDDAGDLASLLEWKTLRASWLHAGHARPPKLKWRESKRKCRSSAWSHSARRVGGCPGWPLAPYGLFSIRKLVRRQLIAEAERPAHRLGARAVACCGRADSCRPRDCAEATCLAWTRAQRGSRVERPPAQWKPGPPNESSARGAAKLSPGVNSVP